MEYTTIDSSSTLEDGKGMTTTTITTAHQHPTDHDRHNSNTRPHDVLIEKNAAANKAAAAGVFITPSRRSVGEMMMRSQLTIDKLDYKHLGLIGREEEIRTLGEVMESINDDDDNDDEAAQPSKRKKQLVWIHGDSGTGKTALARCLMTTTVQQTNQRRRRLFVMGKFDNDDGRHNQPYAGVDVDFFHWRRASVRPFPNT